jgi:hypothetical protein
LSISLSDPQKIACCTGCGPAYDELRKRVMITFDGRTLLDKTATPKDFPSGQVHAGVNAVTESDTAADFSGEILSAVLEEDLSKYLPGQRIRP